MYRVSRKSAYGIGDRHMPDIPRPGIRDVPVRYSIIKRAADILGGLAGCAVTGVLFCFVAPCILVRSPGPVFFVQRRMGKNGRPFYMYKFRSMDTDAEARKKELEKLNQSGDGMTFKLKNDPRIIDSGKVDKYGNPTGFGHFIRKHSIDEFPQFFNVLKGDMSLVGTRPPTPEEYARYTPYQQSRLDIKPGITGLWQVSGRSKIKDFNEIMRLDREYIDNRCLRLDIKILLKTIPSVITGEGAQ
ncbi:MAG: sugar transferase [Clostridia bacterium]|nr:sugar transferase [Clostridia bacterium]MBR5257800.1 sugar transferase [Clostridia bacterium]MBR5985566.1 sugar transferase [Clostridia bacterium]